MITNTLLSHFVAHFFDFILCSLHTGINIMLLSLQKSMFQYFTKEEIQSLRGLDVNGKMDIIQSQMDYNST